MVSDEIENDLNSPLKGLSLDHSFALQAIRVF